MNLEKVTPLVWTLLWLIIGCQSIGAFAEGGREAALPGGDDQRNDQNITPVMSQQLQTSFNLDNEESRATDCYRGMANDTTKQYQQLELIRNNTPCLDILCDTQTDGGGWIVIQRRKEGDVDFDRNWAEYKHGFGTPPGDFWLGNEAIYQLTNRDAYELRIDFNDGDQDLFAVFSSFRLESEADNYRLRLGSPFGTLPLYYYVWRLPNLNGAQFTTYDRDNDVHPLNCAEYYQGGWWYQNILWTNRNGQWRDHISTERTWWVEGSAFYDASSTEMKMRIK